jgi:hypothetical protein
MPLSFNLSKLFSSFITLNDVSVEYFSMYEIKSLKLGNFSTMYSFFLSINSNEFILKKL